MNFLRLGRNCSSMHYARKIYGSQTSRTNPVINSFSLTISAFFMTQGTNVRCEGGRDKGDEDSIAQIFNRIKEEMGITMTPLSILDNGVPLKVSYGAALGFCSGFALKKVGKVGAFIFGAGFCMFQSLSYSGYITVNYEKVGKDLSKLLDLDTNGTINERDGKILYDKALDVLGYNIPTGSGFAGGFLVGIRSG